MIGRLTSVVFQAKSTYNDVLALCFSVTSIWTLPAVTHLFFSELIGRGKMHEIIIKERGFEFRGGPTTITVLQRSKKLGTIVAMLEKSGRRCYRLGIDTRGKKARTYRGRVRAAEVLKIVDTLKQQAKQKKWSPESLILQAWEAKPSTVGE